MCPKGPKGSNVGRNEWLSSEEPDLHGRGAAFHLNCPAKRELKARVEIVHTLQQLVRILRHVDHARLTSGLSAARQVHRVSEQTVAWHPLPDHASHYLARMDADGHFLAIGKRHKCD